MATLACLSDGAGCSLLGIGSGWKWFGKDGRGSFFLDGDRSSTANLGATRRTPRPTKACAPPMSPDVSFGKLRDCMLCRNRWNEKERRSGDLGKKLIVATWGNSSSSSNTCRSWLLLLQQRPIKTSVSHHPSQRPFATTHPSRHRKAKLLALRAMYHCYRQRPSKWFANPGEWPILDRFSACLRSLCTLGEIMQAASELFRGL